MTAQLRGTTGPLRDGYTALLLDLDGTLHLGPDPVAGAAEAVRAARAAACRLSFVTNNASRTPAQVVAHLGSVGVEAHPSEVLTSAQAGARAVARMVPPQALVLVVGGDGLAAAVEDAGLRPVRVASEHPAAVVQGWFPGLGWALLAEGAYALATGVPWVATNLDLTLPTAHGVAPGNGSFVALLGSVTGRSPDVVAGKPGPLILVEAAGPDRSRALVVGDRLDTDIAGAIAAGLDSLLVLTGVTDVEGLLRARPHERPTYVSADLAGLSEQHPPAGRGERCWDCGTAHVSVQDERLVVEAAADRGDLVRALCVASWDLHDAGETVVLAAETYNRLRD